MSVFYLLYSTETLSLDFPDRTERIVINSDQKGRYLGVQLAGTNLLALAEVRIENLGRTGLIWIEFSLVIYG